MFFALRATCVIFSTLSLIMVLATGVSAQPPDSGPGGPRGGGPRGFFGPGGGTGLELLYSAEVRDEIELVEEQEEQLRELGNRLRDEMRSVFGELRELPAEERRDAMMAKFEAQRERVQQELGNILLDHQMERLDQLQLQARLQRGGAADALGSTEIREKLGLTDDQLEQMRQTAAVAEQELRETIRKATEEARNKVLSVLTPDQRATWEAMTGTSFEFENNRRGGRRGGISQRSRQGGPPNTP